MSKPSAQATYERARRFANLSLWTIDLQRRRIKLSDPIDSKFIFRRWADFEFLAVALTRLRRASILAAKVSTITQEMVKAQARFDAALPQLSKYRNVAEHFDDYALDAGRNRKVRRQDLEVSALTDRGQTLNWLGERLNVDEAFRAARALFKEIQNARVRLPVVHTSRQHKRGSLK